MFLLADYACFDVMTQRKGERRLPLNQNERECPHIMELKVPCKARFTNSIANAALMFAGVWSSSGDQDRAMVSGLAPAFSGLTQQSSLSKPHCLLFGQIPRILAVGRTDGDRR